MAVKAERGMGDQLLLLPLTERSVHLCVDMRRIFSTQVLADAMYGQGLAGRGGAREPPPQTNRPNPSSAELLRQREADALSGESPRKKAAAVKRERVCARQARLCRGN